MPGNLKEAKKRFGQLEMMGGILNLWGLGLDESELVQLLTQDKLYRITSLDLGDNLIRKLPRELDLLVNLRTLNIDNLPLPASEIKEIKARHPRWSITGMPKPEQSRILDSGFTGLQDDGLFPYDATLAQLMLAGSSDFDLSFAQPPEPESIPGQIAAGQDKDCGLLPEPVSSGARGQTEMNAPPDDLDQNSDQGITGHLEAAGMHSGNKQGRSDELDRNLERMQRKMSDLAAALTQTGTQVACTTDACQNRWVRLQELEGSRALAQAKINILTNDLCLAQMKIAVIGKKLVENLVHHRAEDDQPMPKISDLNQERREIERLTAELGQSQKALLHLVFKEMKLQTEAGQYLLELKPDQEKTNAMIRSLTQEYEMVVSGALKLSRQPEEIGMQTTTDENEPAYSGGQKQLLHTGMGQTPHDEYHDMIQPSVQNLNRKRPSGADHLPPNETYSPKKHKFL